MAGTDAELLRQRQMEKQRLKTETQQTQKRTDAPPRYGEQLDIARRHAQLGGEAGRDGNEDKPRIGATSGENWIWRGVGFRR